MFHDLAKRSLRPLRMMHNIGVGHGDNDLYFFFSSRRRHTRSLCDWSSDVCSSDLAGQMNQPEGGPTNCDGTMTFSHMWRTAGREVYLSGDQTLDQVLQEEVRPDDIRRSEERRVGKECRSRWSPYH